MGKKRKRPRIQPSSRPHKRAKPAPPPTTNKTSRVVIDDHPPQPHLQSRPHPVLARYYPRLINLRSYLLALLPLTSVARRQSISSLGISSSPPKQQPDAGYDHRDRDDADEERRARLREVAALLDTTLVGVSKPPDHASTHARQRELAAFNQSQVVRGTDVGATTALGEIVDFTILTLFNQHQGPYYSRPSHVLCHGFQRVSSYCAPNHEHAAMGGIPGIVPKYPNKNVSMIKAFPWTDVLNLLGENCEEIMLHLLLDCGLFIALDPERGTYYQLSGIQLSELQVLDTSTLGGGTHSEKEVQSVKSTKMQSKRTLHSPKSIVFVRSRIFYARPALNARGEVKFGLRHIHVLNRYPASTNLDHTVHIMNYIFPRQFGLHNVFTSTVDPKQTAQPFVDYTLREEEIFAKRKATNNRGAAVQNPNKLPKRLRGEIVKLIQKLQKRHQRFAYVELLRHYCPVEEPVRPNSDNKPGPSMTEFATPIACVSAFCRAVMQKLVPNDLLGVGEDGQKNRDVILRQVDSFVRMRRFESPSLHEVAQGLKITCIQWLNPPPKNNNNDNTTTTITKPLSLSDTTKRLEILHELIYYLFDSLLIPLLRSNFYITESNTHRNRLFYFRHDVWKRLVEPCLMHLKSTVFEEVKPATALKILSRRRLGYSTLRMLPKRAPAGVCGGARPIVNLRRRVAVNSKSKYGAGKVELGPSINALLAPVFQMLNYEKGMQAEMLGAAMGSVGDMHGRLKRFRKRVEERRPQQLYFVKLDVQACFDTIPQARLLRLVEDLVSEDEYRVTKYVEVAPPAQQTTAAVHAGTGRPGGLDTQARPARKFVARAAALMDFKSSYEHVMDQQSTQRQGATTTTTRNRSTLAIMKRNTVVADTGYQKRHETDDLLALLEHHVRNHLVKIGKKYFRQKNGIPQGSVVSSILCNFFYGAHEREHLRFLHDGGDGDALLLRLVDDYLLITTDKDIATRFLQVMLDGNSEYGISVTLGKTLVNFDVQINGCKIPRLIAGQEREQFPYCGNLIDTTTLAISKDRTRNKQTNDDNGNDNDLHICDTLTVEVKRTPWQALYRKALTMLRLQLHAMFCDTRHNSRSVVWGNIYDAFVDAAVRLYAYSRSLHHRQRATQYQHRRAARNSPTDDVFTRTIAALIDDGVRLVRSRGREQAAGLKEAEDEGEGKGNRHQVTSVQIRWLAVQAFRGVLGRKQSRVGGTVRWLEALGRVSRSLGDGEAAGLWAVVRARARGEMGYRF